MLDRNLVLVDFDKTIINRDTGDAYIRFMLRRSLLRMICVALFSPLIILFISFNKTKKPGLSILLWLLTAGMGRRKQAYLRRQFISAYLVEPNTRIFDSAIEALTHHVEQGDEVVIVSGASAWMVKRIVAALRLPVSHFLCSQERAYMSGRISQFHCYGANKVNAVESHFNLQGYFQVIGYSDSASDIPLLALCDKRIVINPTSKCRKRFATAFGNHVEVVKWK